METFTDYDGDILEVAAFRPTEGTQAASLRIGTGRAFHAAPLIVPTLCRALYEAVGLEWPMEAKPLNQIAEELGITAEVGMAEKELHDMLPDPDPDRTRVLAEAGPAKLSHTACRDDQLCGCRGDPAFDPSPAGPDLEDRDFVPEEGSLLEDIQNLRKAVASVPKKEAEGDVGFQPLPTEDLDLGDLIGDLVSLRDAHPFSWANRNNLEGGSLGAFFAKMERAGLLSDEKPEDALEVARKALLLVLCERGPSKALTQAAIDALSAIERAKGGAG